MSLSRQSTKRSARVSSNSSKKMKLSPPQADKAQRKVEVFYDLTSSPEVAPQPDSGFCEQLDSDFDSSLDKSLPSYGNSNEDWILYADEDISQDDGYFFQEEDALDIASVKANHGSYLNGHNNEALSRSLSFEDGRFRLNVTQTNNPAVSQPPHKFTNHAISDVDLSTVHRWARTNEQHEELAYHFEQLPQTIRCPQQFEQSRVWNEVIDLSIYDIRN